MLNLATLYFVALFAVTVCPSVKAGETCCPDNWLPFGGSCYFFRDDTPMDWNAALSWCNLHRADLATIDSKLESNFLQSFARKLYMNTTQKEHVAFWLGATDDIIDGDWLWYSTQKSLTFTDWYASGLNVGFSQLEDCLAMNGSYDFKWKDGDCGDRQSFALCEKSGGSGNGLQIIG